MKKLIMAVTAAMLMGTAAMAQSNDTIKTKKVDKAEMVKKRTDAMARQYGLNEEQTAKLLELNTAYADSMRNGMMARGDRRGSFSNRPNVNRGPVKRDSVASNTKEVPVKQRANMDKRKQMGEVMKNYETKLQGIMTPEQYKKYKEAEQNRMNRGGMRGERGLRD